MQVVGSLSTDAGYEATFSYSDTERSNAYFLLHYGFL